MDLEKSQPAAATTTLPPAQAKGADDKFCSHCGSIISVRAEICPKCGVRQMAAPSTSVVSLNAVTAPNGKSRIVAALLAFFLGGFGAHKFYLRQTGWGILYLLFFWTFVPSIIAFVEFIMLLVMSDDEFSRRFGHS